MTTQWLPIESAPRDGTAILIVRYGKESEPTYNVVYFDDQIDEHYPWQFVDGGGSYHPGFPTDWMPLPSPPERE